MRQSEPTMMRFRLKRLYQGAYSACWAFAMSRALHLFLTARGVRVQEPSPAFLYWIGRSEEYAGRLPELVPPLEDRGTYPRLGMSAVQSLGFVEWSVWRYPERVDVRPHAGIYVRAIAQADLIYFRVFETGDLRVDVVAEALMLMHPVIFGMRVGATFESWEGSASVLPMHLRDADAGHMMAVLEIDRVQRRVRVDNWWARFGDQEGTAWLSFDVFGDDAFVSDVYVIRAAVPDLEGLT